MKNHGEILKNEGMQMSLFNADKKINGWSASARVFLEQYVGRFPEARFQTEDVRRWAYKRGLENPPSERAWGSVVSSAKKEGLIRFVGYESVENPLAHMTPAAVWEKVP